MRWRYREKRPSQRDLSYCSRQRDSAFRTAPVVMPGLGPGIHELQGEFIHAEIAEREEKRTRVRVRATST
jgi:hypothetical protein